MLSWFQGNQYVYALIARRNYPKAIEALEWQIKKEPDSLHLRQLLADVLEKTGKTRRAVRVLEPLVDELVADGFGAKAIATLKKIQRVDPERSDIDMKLASLLEGHDDGTGQRVSLISAHLEADPTAGKKAPPGPGSLADDVPDPTSEFVADWFEETVENRHDFHWSPLFDDFSKHELAALIGGLRLLVKKPGAIIYGEDAPGERMFILATGKARVYRRRGSGHYEQVSMLNEGDFFGEASVLTVSNRLSTITAATECELLELDRETFDRISEKYPRIRRVVEHLYGERASFETASLR